MIFKDVCSKPSCTLLFSGENRTCRTTQSCANPLCGRLWNSTRLSGSWNAREERVEGSSRSPLFGQNYNDNSPCHQQPTDSSGESMAPLGLLHVWKSSKRTSPKCHPEPGTRNFCFARTLQSDHTFGSWHPISSRVRDCFADTCTRGVNCRLQHISGNTKLPSAAEKHASYLCEAVIWI